MRGRLPFLAGALALALLLVPAAGAYPDPSDAWTFPSDCSADRHFVYDFVQLLDDTQGAFVESGGCDLYKEDGAHLVLAVVPDLDGETIDSYALHLVREWGIGDDERLDGLLVLYAMDDGTGSGEGAVRIEVGYGLEAVVNALVAREAVESMQAVKAGKLANGSTESEATAHALAAGAAALALFTQQNHEGTPQAASAGGWDADDAGLGLPWWAWLVLAAIVLGLLGSGRRGRGSGFLGGLVLGGMMRRGGGRGGGGWGGRGRGGGGFGGGKSGGGGWGGRL